MNLLASLKNAFGLNDCSWSVYRRKDGSYGAIATKKINPKHDLANRILGTYCGVSARDAIRIQKGKS